MKKQCKLFAFKWYLHLFWCVIAVKKGKGKDPSLASTNDATEDAFGDNDIGPDEIKRALTPPLLSLKELVAPEKWLNIPMPLVQGVDHIIDNAAHFEK